MEFLLRCLQPTAVLMLFVAAVCLLVYVPPGWQDRWLPWLTFLFIGILAIIAWVFLVIG